MKPTSTHCDFCNEFSGGKENSFARIYGQHLESRVLFRNSNFAVLPSLGQIVEGYLLVLPIKHFKALGDLPDSLLVEFAAACKKVGTILKDSYGPYIFFEHGTRNENFGGCGIYHAHLHAVPIAKIKDPVEMLKSQFPFVELGQLSEIGKRSSSLPGYLLYRSTDEKLYLFDTGPIPSQYMRKLLADRLGIPEWDWRKFGREDLLLKTMQFFSTQFGRAHEFTHSLAP